MNTVQPIRSISQIQQIEQILKSQSDRDYILFRLGINSGLRISDILKMKVKDIKNQSYFILKEQKTGKSQRLKIQPKLKQELDKYIKGMDDEDYLIGSRKYKDKLTITIKAKDKDNKIKNIKQKIDNISNNSPIERMQAYRILNDAANEVGIEEPIGCHSLRKTFGYWMFKMCNDITMVQKFLNHSSPQVTLRYIGITQDSMDDLIMSFDFDTFTDDKDKSINNKNNKKVSNSKR